MTRMVNVRTEPYDIYIGRGTPWGNPFRIGRDGTREEVIAKYREHLAGHPELVERAQRELKGRTLGCWCKPEACHGDVLVEHLESTTTCPAGDREGGMDNREDGAAA